MSNLTLRVITAVALVAAIVLSLFVLPEGAAQLLLGVFLLAGAWEWSGFMFRQQIGLRLTYVALLSAVAAYLSITFGSAASSGAILLAGLIWWILVALWLSRFRGSANPVWCGIAGCLILPPAFFAVMRLLDFPRGELLFVWIVCLVAAADIGAYFTGKSIGRRKLALHISPGKTWEGFAGGLVACAVVGVVGATLLAFDPVSFGVAALGIAIFSVLGDLTVSAFKRSAGLKDSGSLLPGHGGVMDRIDGLVAALPLFLLTLNWLGER